MQTAGSVVSVWVWTASRREIVKNPIQGPEGRRGGREQAQPCVNLTGMQPVRAVSGFGIAPLLRAPQCLLSLPRVDVLGPFYLGCLWHLKGA